MAVGEQITVEVVFATEDEQQLLSVALPAGSTVADAISRSKISQRFPGQDLAGLQVGVWGHPVSPDHVLCDADRVEIYRPLKLDPKEARRQLALLGRTMSGGSED